MEWPRLSGLLASIVTLAMVTFCAPLAAQQFHYVAGTKPPDAYLALRSQPSSTRVQRIVAMPNGTLLRVLQRRDDGWWYVSVHPSGQRGWAFRGRGDRVWIHCCSGASATAEPPAPAQRELPGFRTPSNNIHCQIEAWTEAGREASELRCDIAKVSGPIPPKPPSCEFDWGQAFAIASSGRTGRRLCASDTVLNRELKALPYGATWERGGFVCKSDASELICNNRPGHGFALSARKQRLF